ncbi:TetR/AcrR family transcriptional regulator C-terminal domain-containing protein [Dactylosporangium sp. NPDC051485]|uniref:TetR/AcrR family transcriptional regulator C-terminal domain-containing protein n=1 Tax=Dactylosporangium sp. NPDC051485 TaxID=3154846 RepID=UPI003423891C
MPPGTPPVWALPAPPARQRRLGRDEIVAAAMELADEGGTAALTMKAVAARLGPYTPMALYRYVHHKDGLVDLMLDAAAAEVLLPDPAGPGWRAALHDIAAGTRLMIKRHPWYAELVHTRPPAGPHAMRRLECMLRILTGRGVEVGRALTFAALLDRHVVGSGVQEAQEARFERLDEPGAFATVRDLAAADGTVPLLTSWLSAPEPAPPDEQFDLGLAMLLDGIEARLP